MKRLLTCIIGAALFSSCGNDENGLLTDQVSTRSDVVTESTELDDSVDISIITYDDWRQLISSNGEFSTYEEYKAPILTRAYVDSRIVRSYHSCNPRSGLKDILVTFNNREICDEIGIGIGRYIIDQCEVKITLYTGDGEVFYPTVSPNCGFQPDADGGFRGYATSIIGNKIVLTTYLTHIKYDEIGRTYDKWYPVAPSNLIWNYDIYIPHWN